MSEKSVKIQSIINQLAERIAEEPIAQAMLSVVPVFAPVNVFLSARGAKLLQERLKWFIQDTQYKLRQLGEDSLDKEFLHSDEFAYLFSATLEKVIRTYHREKIILFSNIIVNAVTIPYSSVEYKQQFLKIVDDLTPLHIQILKYVCEKQEGRPINLHLKENIVSLSDIKEIAPDISDNRLESFCRRLVNSSLLLDASLQTFGYSPGQYVLTEFALEFLQFVTLESVEIAGNKPCL